MSGGKPKVPHMGWDTVRRREGVGDELFGDLVPPFDFYFVHSYYVADEGPAGAAATATCEHGLKFVAALERDNIFAVQFHPEKSQLAGMKMLEAFVKGPN
jgi:glutamine amidotransferase